MKTKKPNTGKKTGRVPAKNENFRQAISNYSDTEIGDLVAAFCCDDRTFRKLAEGLLVFATTEGHFSDLYPFPKAC